MKGRYSETIIVTSLAMIFFAAFGAVTYLDESHGDIGTFYGEDQVVVDVGRDGGHLTVPEMPEDLLVFGVGEDVSLRFNVINNDPDNDIDTIYITIPDSTITSGSYEWYTNQEHEWNVTMTRDDIVKLEAVDDIEGHEFGTSDQYDVAGNIDDALDSNGDNINEGIEITVNFQAPGTGGIKMGSKAINLEVADEKTENVNAKEMFAPFPYPFTVVADDEEFILMKLKHSPGISLEAVVGSEHLFGPTRGSDFQEAPPYGFKYLSSDGYQVILLNHPGPGKIVKPIIRALEPGLPGTFSLTVFNFTGTDVGSGVVEKTPIVTDYEEDIPQDPSIPLDLDMDEDGLFNNFDPDMDGDGTPNNMDQDPTDPGVFNHDPVNLTVQIVDNPENKVKEGESFEMIATAVDPDSDPITFTWTCPQIPTWSMTGDTVDVPDDITTIDSLGPGMYTFNVVATDGRNGEARRSLTVEVEEKEDKPFPFWIAIIVIVVILIIGIIAFFLVRGGLLEEEEQPTEIEPGTTDVEGEIPGEAAMPGEYPAEMEPPEAPSMEPAVEQIPEAAPFEAIESPEPLPALAPPAMDEEPSEEVRELEQLIDDLERTEEEIGDICPECGASLGPEDSDCPSCGAQFELALECPNCGSVVAEDSPSCPNCGVHFA
ncbi:MAG: zinc ribbon domain-containing protein [Thermoplasmatota archaeon]